MDVSRAQLSNQGDAVVLTDPGFPWTVQARMCLDHNHPVVMSLLVEGISCDHPVTSSVLAQIPARQIASVAASALLGEGEAQYRMLARPRPAGSRSWPEDHFRHVAMVASWARRIGRPGGAAGAVAEFWDVHYRTARRWISAASAPDGDQPSPRTRP